MEHETIAVGRKHEGNVQRLSIAQSLLHSVADGVGVVLGLDQRNGNVGLVIEDVIGTLALAPADQLATHDDPALGEADFLADLQHLIPSGLAQSGCDEFCADVAFGEAFLVYGH